MAMFSNLKGTFQKVFSLGSKNNQVSLRESFGVLQGQDSRISASDWLNILRPEAIQFDVNQSSHGLTVHSPIYCNSGGVWVDAQADDIDTLANAVVIEVIDSNNFSVGMEGSVQETSHGLTVGEYYFTDKDIAGSIVSDVTLMTLVNPVIFVDSVNSYIVLPYRATRQDIGAIGILAGGRESGGLSNKIQYIGLTANCNSRDFGTMAYAKESMASCASKTRGIVTKGIYRSGLTRNIEYVTITTKGNASVYGSCAVRDTSARACGSNTRGIITCGSATRPDITYLTIATTGTDYDFGDMSTNTYASGACSSTTRAIFSGGVNSGVSSNVIDYVTIATTGNAIDFGNLTLARSAQNACSSSVRGLTAGGSAMAGNQDIIDYVTIATTGNAIDFGNLSNVREHMGACSSKLRGVFVGGSNSASVNIIEYVYIATTSNVTDFGDLSHITRNVACLSNDHGGL